MGRIPFCGDAGVNKHIKSAVWGSNFDPVIMLVTVGSAGVKRLDL